MAARLLGAALAAATAVTGASLAAPSAALAQGNTNPFSPGLPQPSAPTTTTTTAPTNVVPTTTAPGSSGGLSSGAAVGIGVGALALLAGISFFIWRDARRRAPARGQSSVRSRAS